MVNDCSAVGCHNKFGWSSLSDKSRSYNEQAPKPHHLQHRYITLRNVRFSIYECSEHSKLHPAVRRRLVPLTRSTHTSASLQMLLNSVLGHIDMSLIHEVSGTVVCSVEIVVFL